MSSKFIVVINNSGELSVYVADNINDAETFVRLFCEDVKNVGGLITAQYSDYAFGQTFDEEDFSIEVFAPGEYRNVCELDYFKKDC